MIPGPIIILIQNNKLNLFEVVLMNVNNNPGPPKKKAQSG
jgi:hypothetical protein